MFEDHYPSADSAATGIVTLLAVAEALGKVKADFTDDDRPIMLSFFHGVTLTSLVMLDSQHTFASDNIILVHHFICCDTFVSCHALSLC